MTPILRTGALCIAFIALLPLSHVATAQAITTTPAAIPTDGGIPISASQAATIAQAATVAATPAPCATPSPDTINGSAGTQPICMTRPDATRPTQTQPVATVTDATCKWSITYPRALNGVPGFIKAEPLPSAAVQPQIVACNVTSATATTATGYCSATQSTTLGGTLTALLGAVVNPMVCASAAQSLTVKVLVRDPTT